MTAILESIQAPSDQGIPDRSDIPRTFKDLSPEELARSRAEEFLGERPIELMSAIIHFDPAPNGLPADESTSIRVWCTYSAASQYRQDGLPPEKFDPHHRSYYFETYTQDEIGPRMYGVTSAEQKFGDTISNFDQNLGLAIGVPPPREGGGRRVRNMHVEDAGLVLVGYCTNDSNEDNRRRVELHLQPLARSGVYLTPYNSHIHSNRTGWLSVDQSRPNIQVQLDKWPMAIGELAIGA